MRVPFAPDPDTIDTALLFVPRFGLLTTTCEEPKSSVADRFSADMIAVEGCYTVERSCVEISAG
jgi:hypothetical protein